MHPCLCVSETYHSDVTLCITWLSYNPNCDGDVNPNPDVKPNPDHDHDISTSHNTYSNTYFKQNHDANP